MNNLEDLKGMQKALENILTKVDYAQDKEHKYIKSILQIYYIQMGEVIEELEDLKEKIEGNPYEKK
ncbi:MAG TPA: hypothetical protein DCK79_03845 [Candidatus Atribacteria bacterium]|jgi:hypothetical protein|nr:MAG: hypothetical protein XE08_0164 [Parcubacteria bacterium 32_520]HAJ32488.1 hypothetical protein [Candidatus Atribacteria bacterium]